ncbi:hypothetical protein PSAL108031_11800 [Ectopseudomonas alcaliphila]
MLVAIEGGEQYFTGFQLAGAKLPQQLIQAAGGDIMK